MNKFWINLQGEDVHIAFVVGQGKRRKHSAKERSHSHSRWAHDPDPPYLPWSIAETVAKVLDQFCHTGF